MLGWISSWVAPRAIAGKRNPQPASSKVRNPFPAAEKNLGILIKSMRRDYQVCMVKEILFAAIMRANLHFECTATDDPKAVALTDHLNTCLQAEMSNLLEALEVGRYAFEWVKWENDVGSGITKAVPRLIEAYDENGTQYSFRLQKDDGSFDGVSIPMEDVEWGPNRTGWIAYWGSTLNPHGKSIYDGAPAEIRASRIGMFELRHQFVKRAVVPIREVHCRDMIDDPDTGEPIDNFAATAAELADAENWGYFFANTARTSDGKDWETTLGSQPTPISPDGMELVITNTDAEISRAFGVHEELAGKGSATGSNGAMSVHQETVNGRADRIVIEFKKGVETEWLTPHLKKNYPNGKNPGIKLVSTQLLQRAESTQTKMALSLLTNNTVPPMITCGAFDTVQIFESAGVPMMPDADKKLESFIDQAAELQKATLGAALQAGEGDAAKAGGSGHRPATDRPQSEGGNGGRPKKDES